MRKVQRITERDLTRIVKRVLNEGAIVTSPDQMVSALDIQQGDKGTLGFNYVGNEIMIKNNLNGKTCQLQVSPQVPYK